MCSSSDGRSSEGRITILVAKVIVMVYVSFGRASRSQRGGRGFESHHLHYGNQGRLGNRAAFLVLPDDCRCR